MISPPNENHPGNASNNSPLFFYIPAPTEEEKRGREKERTKNCRQLVAMKSETKEKKRVEGEGARVRDRR